MVGDLFLWDQNFYANKLGKRDPGLIELLQTPGVLKSGEPISYAFGLAVDTYKGVPIVSHSGDPSVRHCAGSVASMARCAATARQPGLAAITLPAPPT